MEAVGAANTTQAELRLLATPDDEPDSLDYRDYGQNADAPLPTGFEGVSFPEDPIRLLSVQVQAHTWTGVRVAGSCVCAPSAGAIALTLVLSCLFEGGVDLGLQHHHRVGGSG